MPSSKVSKAALFVVIGITPLIIATSAFAKDDNHNKPDKYGWGYGDKNHVHIGPPGQSVNPIENKKIVFTLNQSSKITGGKGANIKSYNIIAIFTGTASSFMSFVNSLGQNIFGS